MPLELRVFVTRLYENIIAKFRTIECWWEEIKCNIIVKQGYPLSPTLFGIYIGKLEECLEVARCDDPGLTGMVITFLLYVDDIVLLAKSPNDLDKQLRMLQDGYVS